MLFFLSRYSNWLQLFIYLVELSSETVGMISFVDIVRKLTHNIILSSHS